MPQLDETVEKYTFDLTVEVPSVVGTNSTKPAEELLDAIVAHDAEHKHVRTTADVPETLLGVSCGLQKIERSVDRILKADCGPPKDEPSPWKTFKNEEKETVRLRDLITDRIDRLPELDKELWEAYYGARLSDTEAEFKQALRRLLCILKLTLDELHQ